VPSFDRFQRELRAQFDRAEKRRAKNVVVNSGELHRAVGGYPGPNERLQTCCEVMKEEVRSGDVIMGDLDNCRGAALTIRYQLPRVEKFVAATGVHPDTDSLGQP
jgi:5-methylcytosine-specific restriction protein A